MTANNFACMTRIDELREDLRKANIRTRQLTEELERLCKAFEGGEK